MNPSGFEPAPLAEHLSNHTPIPIPYRAPIDYTRYLTILGAVLLFGLTVRTIAPVLQNKWTWAGISVLTSLIFTSGYMFTRIRGMPLVGRDGSWIAAGYQNQYGQEVQLIAGLCACKYLFTFWLIYSSHSDGLLSFAFLMLIVVIPYQSSAGRQRLQIYLWSTVIMLLYSVLVAIFKVKNRGIVFVFRSIISTNSFTRISFQVALVDKPKRSI